MVQLIESILGLILSLVVLSQAIAVMGTSSENLCFQFTMSNGKLEDYQVISCENGMNVCDVMGNTCRSPVLIYILGMIGMAVLWFTFEYLWFHVGLGPSPSPEDIEKTMQEFEDEYEDSGDSRECCKGVGRSPCGQLMSKKKEN